MPQSHRKLAHSKIDVTAGSHGQIIGLFGSFIILSGIVAYIYISWEISTGICITGFVIAIIGIYKKSKAEKHFFLNLCADGGYVYSETLSDDTNGYYIGINEGQGRIIVQYPTSADETEVSELDVTRILHVELNVNNHAVYKAGPIMTLSSAAVGGIAFGGVGAIVGSISSQSIGSGKVGQITLTLRLDDLEKPLVRVPFLWKPQKASSASTKARMTLAENWTNAIEVLRYRTRHDENAVRLGPVGG